MLECTISASNKNHRNRTTINYAHVGEQGLNNTQNKRSKIPVKWNSNA